MLTHIAFSGRSTALKRIASAVLVLALIDTVARGILPAVQNSQDLTVGFAAARTWFLGGDPYSVTALKGELLRAGGGALATGDLLDGLRNVYAPTTLPAFMPIAGLAWPHARLVVLGLNLAATVGIAVGLVRLLGWTAITPRGRLLVASVLLLGPVHLTMSLGQTALMATAAVVAGLLIQRSGQPRLAGLLFALATAVKVQIGLPFIAYLVWRRHWLTAVVSGLVLAAVTALSVLRMEIAGVPWFDSWQENLRVLLGPGGVNDPSVLNPERFSLINLQYPLESIVASTNLSNLLVIVLVAAAGLALTWLLRSHRSGQEELLAVSIVAVLGLLVTYHRYYDAVLVALPVAWGLSALGTAAWRHGAVVLLLSLDFVAPILGGLLTLQRQGILPPALTESFVWEVVVLPVHTWVLVALVLVMLHAAATIRPATPNSAYGDVAAA